MITKEELTEYICNNVNDFHLHVNWYKNKPPLSIEDCVKHDYNTDEIEIDCLVMKQDKNNIVVIISVAPYYKFKVNSLVRIGYTRIILSKEQKVRIGKAFLDYLQLTNFSDEQEALNNTVLR